MTSMTDSAENYQLWAKQMGSVLSNFSFGYQGKNTIYKYNQLVGLAYLSSCFGAQNFVEMIEIAHENRQLFCQTLNFLQIPSHDTLNNCFKLLDPTVLASVLFSISKNVSLADTQKLKHIALDGKTINGFNKHQAKYGKHDVHINQVSAYDCDRDQTLGQINTETSKKYEEKHMLELLKCFNLENVLITADAAATHANLLSHIEKNQGFYLVPVKDNQSVMKNNLNKAIDGQNFANILIENSTDSYKDKGFLVEKKMTTYHAKQLNKTAFQGIFSDKFQSVEYICQEIVTKTNLSNGEIKTFDRTFITNLKEKDIAMVHEKIRRHWRIENVLHYNLDVHFLEDKSKTREKTASLNLNTIRKSVLNTVKSLKKAMKIRQFFRMMNQPDFQYLIASSLGENFK